MDPFETLIKSAERMFGAGAVFDHGKCGVLPSIPKISTGSIKLDVSTGGGYAKGRIVEIMGLESSGKTSLCLHAIKEAQNDPQYIAEGRKPLFIDVEHALDLHYAKKLGVDVSNLLTAQPATAEGALDLMELFIKSGKISVAVLDSIAALVPRAELEGEMGDQQIGLQARLMSKAMRKLTGVIYDTGTIVIFTNQIRHKIGVMFGNPETTSGGNALKFYASQRLSVSRSISSAEKDKNGEITSFPTKVKVIKNKLAPPFRTAELDIEMNVGVNLAAEVLDFAAHYDLLQKNGHHYEILDPRRTAFFQAIADSNPQTLEELEAMPHFKEIVDPSSVDFKRVIGPTIKNLKFTDNGWKAAGRANAISSLREPGNKALLKDLETKVRAKLNFAEDVILDFDDSVKE
jgi:recombination protein RecA